MRVRNGQEGARSCSVELPLTQHIDRLTDELRRTCITLQGMGTKEVSQEDLAPSIATSSSATVKLLESLQVSTEACDAAIHNQFAALRTELGELKEESLRMWERYPRLAQAMGFDTASTAAASMPATFRSPSGPNPRSASLQAGAATSPLSTSARGSLPGRRPPGSNATGGPEGASVVATPYCTHAYGVEGGSMASARGVTTVSFCDGDMKRFLQQYAEWGVNDPLCVSGQNAASGLPTKDEAGRTLGFDKHSMGVLSPHSSGLPSLRRPSFRMTADELVLLQLQYDGVELTAAMRAGLGEVPSSKDPLMMNVAEEPMETCVMEPEPCHDVDEAVMGADLHARISCEIRRGIFERPLHPLVCSASYAASGLDAGAVEIVQRSFPLATAWLQRLQASATPHSPHSAFLHEGQPPVALDAAEDTNLPHTHAEDLTCKKEELGGVNEEGSEHLVARYSSWSESHSGDGAYSYQLYTSYDEEAMEMEVTTQGDEPAVPHEFLAASTSQEVPAASQDTSDEDQARAGRRPMLAYSSEEEEEERVHTEGNSTTYLDEPATDAVCPTMGVSEEELFVSVCEPIDTTYPDSVTQRFTKLQQQIADRAELLLSDLAIFCALQQLACMLSVSPSGDDPEQESAGPPWSAQIVQATEFVRHLQGDALFRRRLNGTCPVAVCETEGKCDHAHAGDGPSPACATEPNLVLAFQHILAALAYVPLLVAAAAVATGDVSNGSSAASGSAVMQRRWMHFAHCVVPFLFAWETDCSVGADTGLDLRKCLDRNGGSGTDSELSSSATLAPIVWLESVCADVLEEVSSIAKLEEVLHELQLSAKGTGRARETLGEWAAHHRQSVVSHERPLPSNSLSRWVFPLSERIVTAFNTVHESGMLPVPAAPTFMETHAGEPFALPPAVVMEETSAPGIPPTDLPWLLPSGWDAAGEDGEMGPFHRMLPIQLSSHFGRHRAVQPHGNAPSPLREKSPVKRSSTVTNNAVLLELPHASTVLRECDERLARASGIAARVGVSMPGRGPGDDGALTPLKKETYYSIQPFLSSVQEGGVASVRWKPTFSTTMCYCPVTRRRCLDPLVAGAVLESDAAKRTCRITSRNYCRTTPSVPANAVSQRATRQSTSESMQSFPLSRPILPESLRMWASGRRVGGATVLPRASETPSPRTEVRVPGHLTKNLLDPVSSTLVPFLNPPDLLKCGHVISQKALLSLCSLPRNAWGSDRSVLRCPYCTRETALNEVLTLSYIF